MSRLLPLIMMLTAAVVLSGCGDDPTVAPVQTPTSTGFPNPNYPNNNPNGYPNGYPNGTYQTPQTGWYTGQYGNWCGTTPFSTCGDTLWYFAPHCGWTGPFSYQYWPSYSWSGWGYVGASSFWAWGGLNLGFRYWNPF